MRKIVLSQVGEEGAGQDTVFAILREYLPPGMTFSVHRFSDPLGEALKLLGLPLNRNNYQLLSQILNDPLNHAPDPLVWIGAGEMFYELEYIDRLISMFKIFNLPVNATNMATFVRYINQPTVKQNRLTWKDLSPEQTESILANTVKRRALADSSLIVGLDGVRYPADEKMLRTLPPDVSSILVYTTANADIRYKWQKKRKEKAGEEDLSREQFDREEKAHAELFIPQIGSRANWRIDNNGTEEDLTEKVEEFFKAKIRPVLPLLRLKATISS